MPRLTELLPDVLQDRVVSMINSPPACQHQLVVVLEPVGNYSPIPRLKTNWADFIFQLKTGN